MASTNETMPVAERFVSINGEGLRAGQLSAFIRFAGCDLACSYCDTAWARDTSAAVEHLTVPELVDWAFAQHTWNITLTGGEPLEQPALLPLVDEMMRRPVFGYDIELETNGAHDLSELHALRDAHYGNDTAHSSLNFTVDWKMPSSGMADRMISENIELLSYRDVLKFVCGTKEDLAYAKDVLDSFSQIDGEVFFSPVFGKMDPAVIVDFLKDNAATSAWAKGARLQLQLHKIIWPGVEKGV